MALRKLVYENEPLLRKPSRDVKEITPHIKTLISDMWDTLYDADGVGLAAPQVGVLRKVIVIDTSPAFEKDDDKKKKDEPTEEGRKCALINPEIVSSSEETVCGNEGCLSVPGVVASVERKASVVVKALDEDGKPVEIEADGFFAKALQHEIDHLHGTLITDIAYEIEETERESESE